MPPRRSPNSSRKAVTFASVGDVHGDMHAMVRLLDEWEKQRGRTLDFVLQVGDFEPHRHEQDLESASIPTKYRSLGDFPDFHAGRASFRWPVYFIGGNHEPYGFLETIPGGGEVAPGCHYLGRVSRLQRDGLVIVGLTGIYKESAFGGRPPLRALGSTPKKAFTYFSENDITRALTFGRADILVVHEWPLGAITPEQREDVRMRRRGREAEEVGNPWARKLVDRLRPRLVVAGHMHWRHRSRIGGSLFAAMGHIDTGSDALGVFEVRDDGSIEELE
jgi:lariat debranching enzyme